MVDGRLRIGRRLQNLAVQVIFQNRFQALVGADLERHGAPRGGFYARVRVLVPEPDDAQAGAEALLRMRSLAQNDLDQRRCLRPDLVRPSLDALRRPVGIAPVARRHMFAYGRVAAVR